MVTSPFMVLIPAAIFFAANGLAFLLFFSDKRRAQRDVRRIPEGTLLCAAAFGPFGAFVAMQVFRHKTRKARFLLVPVFLALQVALVCWIVGAAM